jgi:hypothetical protein
LSTVVSFIPSQSMHVLLAVLGCVPALAPALHAQTPFDVDALRAALAQPGPEARGVRETAVEALLSRKEPAAHAVLHQVVRDGADADGVAFTILSQLRRKLGNPQDPVFGANERDKGVGRSYVPALAALFAIPPIDSAAERELREEARQCLAALSAADRRRAIETLLQGEDAALRRGALLLAGGSRDLGLAPLIAAWLDVADQADVAREALAQLTFADAFGGRAQFEEWWEANRERSYVILAEAAARLARDARSAAQRRAEQRTTEVLADLVEAWAAQEDVPWARIAERALADEPVGSTRVCLERLRDVLARAPRTGGAGSERLAFLQQLVGLLSLGPPSVAARAVLLELTAYLVTPGEEKADEVVTLLRAGLAHESPAVRRAAALGLARFPGAESTQLLVRAGLRARQTAELPVLSAVLAALAAPGRTAPADSDADTFPAWLELMDGVLRDDAMPEQLRDAALSVLEQRGASGKLLGQVFSALVAVTKSKAHAPFIRERAALALQPHAAADVGAAGTYVATLLQLLEDPEKRMRLKAAQLLQTLPKHRDAVDSWRTEVLSGAGARLAQEPDEAVLRALVTCLERQVDADKPDLEPVISRLCTALQELTQAGRNGTRRQTLVNSLAGLAATQGLDTMKWVRAAEALVELGERREVRNVIERQRPLQMVGRDGVHDEVVRRALATVVATALLRPRSEALIKREAGDVLEALAYFDQRRVPTDAPPWRLLRLDALAAHERWDEVVAQAQQEVKDGKLGPADLDRVRAVQARAHLGLGDVDAAVTVFGEGLTDLDSAVAASLAEDIGAALSRKQRKRDAVAWLTRAQQLTAESDPLFARRLLRRLDAEGQAEPELRPALLAHLLQREALFSGPDAGADLRAEFEQVKLRLSGKL